jgi:hypothetical protein
MTEEAIGSRNLPMCPICGNNTFQQQRGKLDSECG